MKYELDISEIDNKVLCDAMEDPVAWVQSLLDSEIAKRRRNLIQRKTSEDIANPDVTTITADESTILNSVFEAPDYKNVAQKMVKPSS